MKTKLFSTVIFLHLLFIQIQAQPDKHIQEDGDWNHKAMLYAEKMAYGFYTTGTPREFRASNTRNHLFFTIKPTAYTVSPMKQEKANANWSIRFSLHKAGRQAASFTEPISQHQLTPEKLTYESSQIGIEYINNEQGLRQNFIIKQKPDGKGPLLVQVGLQTSLQVKESATNQLSFFESSASAQACMVVDGLKVWDADHKILPAALHLKENRMEIRVNDEGASYPITIDPLNRAPEWTTSADGILPGLLNNLSLQVQTLYGYTVAGLGDINGDGYDDVAISAPGMADVITGTGSLSGVGGVFIYLGSPLGLSTTPSKILQPTTAVSGALFGFSVDAGDITGDGKNDIIISAPLDKYETAASGLLGPVNVEVTAGKVYIYRSEDLFSTANPSPFLDLKLQGTDCFSTGVLNLFQSNVNVKPLFGYSVAVSPDLNGDNKCDILVGVPSYLGTSLLSVQSGAAFVYYSDNLNTTTPEQLATPDPSLLGIITLPVANTNGLLFGFSIDAAGDYNGDGNPDVVVGAPAGADLSSLGGIFTGQFLGGSAYVFTGNAAGINPTSSIRLQAKPTGLLSNAADLFGYKVKGVTNAFNTRTGNILVGAPAGVVLSNVVNGLRVKAGQVHVFKKKTGSVPADIVGDQVLSSPRSSSILSILSGQTINVSLLYGSSIDNMLDVNCDNIGDIIVGEPLSTAVPLIGADVIGGAAYIYLGQADGTYSSETYWDLHCEVSPLLGVNTTSLLGFSVAGARHVKGETESVRALIGGPSNALDYGNGLLALGNTLGTTFSFVFDNNGLGKSYMYGFTNCNIILPLQLLGFTGRPYNKTSVLNWVATEEENLNYYELEKSTDGIRFTTLAIVFPENQTRNEYSYTDKYPQTGANYYRLKMVGKDRSLRYSPIATIHFNDVLPGSITIAPNPVVQDINLRINAMANGSYRATVVNASGQQVATQLFTISQPGQTIRLNTGQLSTGIYRVIIYDHTGTVMNSLQALVNN